MLSCEIFCLIVIDVLTFCCPGILVGLLKEMFTEESPVSLHCNSQTKSCNLISSIFFFALLDISECVCVCVPTRMLLFHQSWSKGDWLRSIKIKKCDLDPTLKQHPMSRGGLASDSVQKVKTLEGWSSVKSVERIRASCWESRQKERLFYLRKNTHKRGPSHLKSWGLWEVRVSHDCIVIQLNFTVFLFGFVFFFCQEWDLGEKILKSQK